MRTEALIRALAADASPARPMAPRLVLALLAAALLVAAVALPLLGVRPDLGPRLMLAKAAAPAVLALAGVVAALRLARPDGTVGRAGLALAAVPLLVAGAVALEFAALPRAGWGAAVRGSGSAVYCLTLVPLMALPLLGASLWALAGGASTRPGLSGMLAGIASGGVAAGIYAFHCIEDTPAFYLTWYGLGILAVAGVGAVAGPRVLRW